MKKKGLAVLGILVATLSIAATSTLLTTMTIARLGGFTTSSVAFDSLNGGQIGGRVVFAVNGESTDSLHVGEVVFWSDTNKVSKSTTLADYNKIAGIVVGGHLLTPPMSAAIAKADTSTRAAKPGGFVVICKQCRTYLLNDANGALAAGDLVIPSNATQGRIEVAPSSIDTLYRMIGRVVFAAAASKTALVDVNIK